MNKFFDWLFDTPLTQPDEQIFPTPVQDEIVGQTMGDYLNALGLRVVHIHGQYEREGYDTTVVYRPRQDHRHTLEVATAICGPRDTFSKKIGLQIALRRWEAGARSFLPPYLELDSDVETLKGYFA